MRPDWDRTWLEVAHVIGRRSICSRAKVGAVIVSEDNRILASGYNGPPANWLPRIGDTKFFMVEACDGTGPGAFCARGKFGPTPETVASYSDCPSIHAEQNALNFCDRLTRAGGGLYVTSHVCVTCAKNVANSGLVRVVVDVRSDDQDREYREPELSYQLLRDSGLSVVLLR